MTEHEHPGLLTDEALLHNIAHGCEDCFDLLFSRFFRPILNLAYKIIRDRPEAEDVVQEVFLAIHEQRERFDPSVGTARTWVLQFGYYKSLKRRRYLSKRHFYEPHVRVDDGGVSVMTVPISVVMLFAVGTTLVIASGFVLYVMIGEINRKLP